MTTQHENRPDAKMEILEPRRLLAAISVGDFGAKPNDGQDDTAAIRAAIRASKDGDTIHFGEGTYNVSSTIELSSNRSYIGNNSVLKRPAGQDFILSTDGQASNFTITGMTLDGAGITFNGGQAQNVKIINNTFQNLTGGWTVGNAILVPRGMKDSLIQGNTFKNILGETGIFGFASWDNTLITENHFEDVMEGIHMWYQGDGLSIVDNTFHRIRRMGVELQGVDAQNTLVEGNYLTEWREDRYHESFALSIVNFGDNTIIRNNFMSSGKPGQHDPRANEAPVGIEVAGRNVIVEGNVVEGFREGMHLMYTPDAIVRKNSLSNQTWMAIWRTGVHEAERVTIEDNIIIHPKQYAFLWQGSADTAAGTVIRNNRIELNGNSREFEGNRGNVALSNIINQGIPDIPTLAPPGSRSPTAPTAPATPVNGPKPVYGNGNGLMAQYFDRMHFRGPSIVRTDAIINNEWGLGSPDATIHEESFSARWIGQVQATTTEEYTFHVAADDGVRLWINGQLVVDAWYDHSRMLFSSPKIKLEAGKKYDIRMEYYEHGGEAVAKLGWSTPSQAMHIIPTSQLYSTPVKGTIAVADPAAVTPTTPVATPVVAPAPVVVSTATTASKATKTTVRPSLFSNVLITGGTSLLK